MLLGEIPNQEEDTTTPRPHEETFSLFVRRLEERSNNFEHFLNDESSVSTPRNYFQPPGVVSKSVENFQVTKLKLLKDIEDDEQSDYRILEQFKIEKERCEQLSIDSDRRTASVLSLMSFEADPLHMDIEEFGQMTAKAQELAINELAALIDDQEQQDGRWSSREPLSPRRPMSARLLNVAEENRIFYERFSKQSIEPTMVIENLEMEIPGEFSSIREIEEETRRIQLELAENAKRKAANEERVRNQAAIKIQSIFRSYCIRKRYGKKLKQRISDAKKRFFEERVRRIELERQRLAELKDTEEKQRKRKLEEEEERRAADIKAREEQQRIRKEEEERQAATIKALEEQQRVKNEEELRRVAEIKALEEQQRTKKEEEERQARLRQLELEEKTRKAEEEHIIALHIKVEEEKKLKAEELRLAEIRQRKLEEEKLLAEKQIKTAIKAKEAEKDTLDRSRTPQLITPNQSRTKAYECNLDSDTAPSSSFKKSHDSFGQMTDSRPKSRASAKEGNQNNGGTLIEHCSADSGGFPKDEHTPRASSSLRLSSSPRVVGSAQRSVELAQSLKANRKPKLKVDEQERKTQQMMWVQSCHPWSETIARLKVATGRPSIAKQSIGRNAIRPPADCKSIPLQDLLSKALGRSHPTPSTITCLVLSHHQLQFDISVLSAMSNLFCLDISHSNFTYLSNLDSCSKLVYINASHNKIKDIELNRMENLAYLDVSYNELTSLNGISCCYNLTMLNASYNRFVRVNIGISQPAALFTRVHTVDLSHNQLLSTRDWLHLMPSIIALDVSSNNLRAIEGLENLGMLQFLNASYNSLNEIPELTNSPLLIDLDCSGNNLHSIENLSTKFLPHLIRLNISRNMISKLPNLKNLLNLIELRFENNQIITYDSLMKNSEILFLPRLKFLRGDFLCFNLEDANRLNEELRISRGIEMISADYDTALSLCASLKLLISAGLIEDEESENNDEDDEYVEFARFVVLLQDNLASEIANFSDKELTKPDNSKRKPAAVTIQPLESKWTVMQKYYEESSKGALERRYAVEFCGIQTIHEPINAPVITEKMNVTNGKSLPPVLPPAPRPQSSGDRKAKAQQDAVLLQQRRRDAAALVIQSGWRGFLARYEVARWHVAATIIQKTWRGYWIRKQIKQVFDQMLGEPEGGPGSESDAAFYEDFNDKSVDDLMSFLSEIKHSTTESINLTSSRSGSRIGKPDHREAWNTPTPRTEHHRLNKTAKESFDEQFTNADSPLPAHLASNFAVPPIAIGAGNTSSRLSNKKIQHIQEEWGFADTTTVELMMRRANRMKQADKKKKLAKLDANQRLALARKQASHETVRSPASFEKHSQLSSSREPYHAHEIRMGAGMVDSNSNDGLSADPSISSQKQTFAWVHSVVREPSPMPIAQGLASQSGFPPISGGGFMMGSGVASNRSANHEANRRRSDDIQVAFPPISVSKPNSAASNANTAKNAAFPKPLASEEEKPKKRDLIRAWREPQVRLSGGWGGGRAGKKKK